MGTGENLLAGYLTSRAHFREDSDQHIWILASDFTPLSLSFLGFMVGLMHPNAGDSEKGSDWQELRWLSYLTRGHKNKQEISKVAG